MRTDLAETIGAAADRLETLHQRMARGGAEGETTRR